jgi:hypothetical protein
MPWSKKPVSWKDPDTGDAMVSVAFTWDLPQAKTICTWWAKAGYHVRAGGPAVRLQPEYLSGVADCSPPTGHTWPEAIIHHNPLATVTSRGCIRSCSFCAVPLIEGDLVELEEWTPRPLVSDNNLLACSRKHFDRVIDSLKTLHATKAYPIDFNQGLDLRLLTPYHADRLAELNCLPRLALDHSRLIPTYARAHDILRRAGFPKKLMPTYVLIGYDDDPADALHRLRLVQNMGANPYPMRYNPYDVLERDSYVGPNWTDELLSKTMRYWTRLRYLGGIPFADFVAGARPPRHRTTEATP